MNEKYKNMTRDNNSNAVLNTDYRGLKQYKAQKAKYKEIDNMKEDISELKNDIYEIKNLLKGLTGN